MDKKLAGGCQCGRVRFEVTERLGRPSICHCRMCQKAFGNAFAPLVPAFGLIYTNGAPKHFASSNKVKRGFCADCGTPLTYEFEGEPPEIAIAALDDPSDVTPVIQVGLEGRLHWVEHLAEIRARTPEEIAKKAPIYAAIVSNQRPDGG